VLTAARNIYLTVTSGVCICHISRAEQQNQRCRQVGGGA